MTTVERPDMTLPAGWVPGLRQGEWTYDAYAALPGDGQRYEIINGVLIMAPSPSGPHQDAALCFGYYLLPIIEFAGLGKVRISPADVELSPHSVVYPDVFVVLKEHMDRVKKQRVIGAPDLVIEFASPGTAALDRLAKYELYARHGVSEYWIAKPETRTIEVMVLENGSYRSPGIFQGQQMLPSRIVPNLPVRVEQFFA